MTCSVTLRRNCHQGIIKLSGKCCEIDSILLQYPESVIAYCSERVRRNEWDPLLPRSEGEDACISEGASDPRMKMETGSK